MWEMIKWMTKFVQTHYASLQWNRNSVELSRPMGLLFLLNLSQRHRSLIREKFKGNISWIEENIALLFLFWYCATCGFLFGNTVHVHIKLYSNSWWISILSKCNLWLLFYYIHVYWKTNKVRPHIIGVLSLQVHVNVIHIGSHKYDIYVITGVILSEVFLC